MIHIKIRQSWNDAEIIVFGHANYAEPGKDIVCSAVSTLFFTLVESIDLLSDSVIHVFEESDSSSVHIGGLYEYSRALVDSFRLGCQEIASKYPDNVSVKEFHSTVKSDKE